MLLFHIISARPSKQPLIIRSFLKVCGTRLLFLFLQEQLKDIIIRCLVVTSSSWGPPGIFQTYKGKC